MVSLTADQKGVVSDKIWVNILCYVTRALRITECTVMFLNNTFEEELKIKKQILPCKSLYIFN